MKSIIRTNSPAVLPGSRSLAATQDRERWPYQPRFLAAVVNEADLRNPWEHAVWIVLGVVALLLVLVTFVLS